MSGVPIAMETGGWAAYTVAAIIVVVIAVAVHDVLMNRRRP